MSPGSWVGLGPRNYRCFPLLLFTIRILSMHNGLSQETLSSAWMLNQSAFFQDPDYLWMPGGGLVAKSCQTLCDPMDCSPPGSFVHWIFQVRILEGIAISFSRGTSRPRDWTQVSCGVGNFLYCRWILYQLSHQGTGPCGCLQEEINTSSPWNWPFQEIFARLMTFLLPYLFPLSVL